jgi:glycosyltransferase involved in cell wall biosynthesis
MSLNVEQHPARPSVAVLIPCFNEEVTIARVVGGFRAAVNDATIFVYDNNSADGTSREARAAGAIVRTEPYQGKGNVVRRMFADVDADVYVLVDGDLTYDPSAAGQLIARLIEQNLDMVVGTRVAEEDEAFRRGHRTGNRGFNMVVASLFGAGFTDVLSGYRVVSRRFAKSFPATSSGFEIETELAIHALDLKLAVAEVPLRYGARPQQSESKLRTYRDGTRILLTILRMYRTLHPLRFFGVIAIALALLALVLSEPLIVTYLETGLVPRFPTAILVMGLLQLAVMSGAVGLILHELASARREQKLLRYLDYPSPAARHGR